MPGVGFNASGSGIRVSRRNARVSRLFRVLDSGYQISGSRFWISDLDSGAHRFSARVSGEA